MMPTRPRNRVSEIQWYLSLFQDRLFNIEPTPVPNSASSCFCLSSAGIADVYDHTVDSLHKPSLSFKHEDQQIAFGSYWRVGSVGKSAFCSSRGRKFCSRHPCQVVHNCLVLFLEGICTLLASSSTSIYLAYTRMRVFAHTCTHTDEHTHINI